MLEFTDPRSAAIPKEDREYLKAYREPIPGWRIWLAPYADRRTYGLDCWHNSFMTLSRGTPTEVAKRSAFNTTVTTMVIGELVAHLYRSTALAEHPGYKGVNLTQIW